jgi:quercetin dioxygenase-like cupin family protein
MVRSLFVASACVGLFACSKTEPTPPAATAATSVSPPAPAAPAAAAPASTAVTYIASDKVSDTFKKGGPLFSAENFKISAGHRDAAGKPAEVHTKDTDIFYVVQGSATFVTGGELVNGAPDNGNAEELRGPSTKGGEPHKLAKGDVIVIPRGVPHWFTEITPPFDYFVVEAATASGSAPPASTAVTYIASDKVSDTFKKGGPLFAAENFKIMAGHRDAAGKPAEVHVKDRDIFYIVQGSATFVTGGELVGGAPDNGNADELRGPSTKGGETHKLAKGDVITIPRAVPHWFTEVTGPFDYFVVKVAQ